MKNFIQVHNHPESMLSFYNYGDMQVQSHIWDELKAGLWKTFNIENFLFNNLLPSDDVDKNKPIFEGFHQIVAGTQWSKELNRLIQCLYTPVRYEHCSLNDLIEAAGKYFMSLKAKRIGVHLSGGFDSSLIMAILKQLGIPFVPVGLKSETFEFRTERQIQDIMMEWGEDGLLIDIEDHPHYSDLDKIAIHQIPDSDIKTVSGANAMAEAFAARGCDVVFTGLGGDSLFVDAIPDINQLQFNIGNEFINPTEADRIYAPRGIRLVSFFAHTEIINIICSAREGKKLDFLKLWARQWAKSILPNELTEKSYCADFFGLSMWGLEQARPTIKRLMEESYEISGNPCFNADNTRRFLEQDVYSFEYRDYINYCGLISIASWFHSLFNNGK